MPSFTKALNSQVGRKIMTGITGIGLMLFLIGHLAGNLTLFGESEAFNVYTHTLESLGSLLYVIESGLAFFFLYHAILGISIWRQRKKARPEISDQRWAKSPVTGIQKYDHYRYGDPGLFSIPYLALQIWCYGNNHARDDWSRWCPWSEIFSSQWISKTLGCFRIYCCVGIDYFAPGSRCLECIYIFRDETRQNFKKSTDWSIHLCHCFDAGFHIHPAIHFYKWRSLTPPAINNEIKIQDYRLRSSWN